MWAKWLPWRLALRRLARTHDFVDPITLLAQLRRFSQPSEVAEPIELLRAGVVFHARGLINSRVIQHNLDWVWPYWIEQQFDPTSDAFVPRAFSLTHINLTHRNWTAIGLPNLDALPIVDPRGLLTPFYDGWSLDGWVIGDDGGELLPSRATHCAQQLVLDDELAVVTATSASGRSLTTRAWVQVDEGVASCRLNLRGCVQGGGGWLALALRPYNPEGVSFVHQVALAPERRRWRIDEEREVEFGTPAERHHVSRYALGDVHIHLHDREDQSEGTCGVGMATAAALFRLDELGEHGLDVRIPMVQSAGAKPARWSESLTGRATLRVPDADFERLYETALRTLVLHSPDEVYAGPYTYKRFWFRDATLIIHALLCAGLEARARRALERLLPRQRRSGYFHSQDGEWDSNGQVLWLVRRYCELTGEAPPAPWRLAIERGAQWISRKRLTDDQDTLHAGLLPAGFSAEHLGPNDYYYWDDFWGVAGLHAAAWLAGAYGDQNMKARFEHEAEAFSAAIERSLEKVARRLGQAVLPASPHRRMDAGAIGSVVATYPAAVLAGDDPRVLGTLEFLLGNCFVDGGFFQDMIHSGINPYLTLHIAQGLLRAGDPRALELVERVAALATTTGQWPEAVHPRTKGGCMGDGQHVWGALEWVMMTRNCFVREEGARLVLGCGLNPKWTAVRSTLAFGPAPTAFGTISLEVTPHTTSDAITLQWQASWRTRPTLIEVRVPGFEHADVSADSTRIDLRPRALAQCTSS